MTQGINLKDSIVLNTMSMFGAPFGIFIAMLVMDKIPRKTMGVGPQLIDRRTGYLSRRSGARRCCRPSP
ncbi:hypothetical protein, partial [Pseudomonas aeruginosa]|uniref:hypothetical protein n=1 Tax=Pseudomonas aeruginosa TaxID=287 RepID=UPI0031B78714